MPKLVTNVTAGNGCHRDRLLCVTSPKWLFFLWALCGLTVASICLNIGHILLQGTISYISALTTSCQISPVLILMPQIEFESLPPCAFLSPLEEEKMRRRIRQRVCQLTHSDLGVSHGWGKKARPGGTPRGRGESLLPSLHCTTTSRWRAFAPVC